MNRPLLMPAACLIAFALCGADNPQAVPAKATPAAAATLPVVPPKSRDAHRLRRRSTAEPVPVPVRRVARANRAATQEPNPQAFINAVQVYPYADGALYQVYAAPERVTDIALQPGEALGAVASGDTVRWVIGDTTSGAGATKRTHILLKPFTAGLATNVLITTDRRTYHLALTSTAGTAMVALSWTYPADQLIAITRAAEEAKAAAPVAEGLSIEQLHFNYAISGDQPAWRPLRAFDDGRQTYIEFPASLAVEEAPPLFLVDAKGEASLVNYRLRGRFYVVDRIFDAAELRLGAKHQDVVRVARIADMPVRRRGS